jgi:hypothetical protein
MKWDIDREILKLETETIPGTTLSRSLMDASILEEDGVYGVRLTPEQKRQGYGLIWCLSVGKMGRPKVFFYGQTIRQCYLKAIKAAKMKHGRLKAPWGEEIELKRFRSKKP